MDGCFHTHVHFNVVIDTRNLVRTRSTVSFSHVFREVNNVVDVLAKHGLTILVDMRLFDVQPSFLSLYLLIRFCWYLF